MAAGNAFDFYQREDIQLNLTATVADEDGAASEAITGWTLEFRLGRSNSTTEPAVYADAVITVTDAAAGTVSVVIPSAASALLLGDYRHSLWRTNSGALTCLSVGAFSVKEWWRQ